MGYPNKSPEPDRRRRRQPQQNQRTSQTVQTSDRVVMNNSYDLLLKLLVIGNSSVGKSAFIYRYTDYMFNISAVHTLGIDFRLKTIDRQSVNGNKQRIRLQIWDTAGQERYRTIITSYFRKADGCLLMYDVSDRESFDMIEQWLQLFKDNAPDRAQIVLVGNKCDLSGGSGGDSDDDYNQHRQQHRLQQPKKRMISYEMGRQLADKLKLDFFETSVKDNVNVDDVFDRLVDIICDNHMLTESPEPTNMAIANIGTVILDNDNNNNSHNKRRKKSSCCK
ncbi:ras-related protein Rab-3-like [Oppia nitens]|uniref:ras-related protein Rab-3-like n=1 Tax=Oppia nitens TaxID=1686743 RepID=UPI0023DC821A|nr:ras-related protein Rab-3-like [Oppia nitens]